MIYNTVSSAYSRVEIIGVVLCALRWRRVQDELRWVETPYYRQKEAATAPSLMPGYPNKHDHGTLEYTYVFSQSF